MKVIFMGTPDFAVPTLQRLIESPHEVALVVTQPDRPAGRGRGVKPSPVKVLALQHGFRIEQPAKLRGTDFHRAVMEPLGADVAVVAAYGLILPPEALAAPKHGCLNVHASLLPRWRGAAPVQRAILAGDLKTGVTIMQMDKGMDTGPIIDQQEIDILPDDDALSVSNMLSALGADMMMKTLETLEHDGRLESRPQDESLATLAPKIEKEDGWIDWAEDMDAIICRVHAMRPRPGAFSRLGGKIIKIVEAEPDTSFDDSGIPEDLFPKPGTVVAAIKRLGPVVRVGDGYLLLSKVQPENKQEMDGGSWINGGGVKLGAVFAAKSA